MIDTRTKILPLKDAPRGRRVVTSFFDPILPAHLEALAAIAGNGSIVVLLRTPDDAYLEPRARAELAAALSFVEAVVISEGDLAAELSALAPSERIPADESESRLRADFLTYVRNRARQ